MRSTKSRANKGRKPQQNRFRVTDLLVQDASSTTQQGLETRLASGVSLRPIVLSPMGINVPKNVLGASNVTATSARYCNAHMPWFYNTSRNYSAYRITGATLVLSAQGMTPITGNGTVNIWSSSDVTDIDNYNNVQFGSSANSRSISLSSVCNGDKRVRLNVDSSWKKVSAYTFTTGSSTVDDTTVVCTTSTVNDLAFTSFFVSITAQGLDGYNPLVYRVEYDVEFKDPVSLFINV